MQTFIGDMVRFGWDTFKQRGWFFVGMMVFIFLISSIASQIGSGVQNNPTGTALIVGLAGVFVSIVANILIKMGTMNFLLKAHDAPLAAKLSDLWAPEMFWQYLGASIVVGVIVVVGLVLLIVPGIIWALRYIFTPYLVIDRKLGVFAAMAESSRITKGRKGRLLVLLLAMLLINIVGAICLLVGLLVSVPVTMLALTHAYRTLEHTASEVAPATA